MTSEGAREADPRRGRALELLVPALAAASLAELLVLRAFTRTAIHIPAMDQAAGPFAAVSWLGRYAYYVAAVLLLVLLPLAARGLWSRGTLPARVGAAAVAFFALAALGAKTGDASPLLVDGASAIAAVLLASAAAGAMDRRSALGLGAFALAFLLGAGHTMVQDAAAEGIATFDSRPLLGLAEVAVVAFACAAPFTFRAQPGPRAWAASAAVAAAMVAALIASPSTVKVLLLWNEGVAGVLPVATYGLAAGGLVAAIAGLVAQRRLLAAASLVLLVTGGIGLHSTYQTGLVVAGLASLSLLASSPAAERSAAGRSPTRAWSSSAAVFAAIRRLTSTPARTV